MRCGGVVCAEGLSCIDDECVADACDPDDCGAGRTCFQGECADDPCADVACPPNQRCALHDETAQCVADWVQYVPPDGGLEADTGPDMEAPEPADMDRPDGALLDDFEGMGGTVGADAETAEIDGNLADCNCDASRGPPNPVTWLLFLLPFAVRRLGSVQE